MKHFCTSVILLLSVMTLSKNSYGQDTYTAPVGPYIGQKPPGLFPEVFAPGIVSTEHHEWGGGFTPDMKEFYFARKIKKSGKVSRFVLKLEDNSWHKSEVEAGMGGNISP